MCKWKELAVAAGFVYLLWKYCKGDDDEAPGDPNDSQQKQSPSNHLAKSANDADDEDVTCILRRLRDQETNLIRYCVLDRALFENSEHGPENSDEYHIDTEVINNPQRYADLTMTVENLRITSQRAKAHRDSESRPLEQIRQEIAHLKALVNKERNTILHCVYERAMQERLMQLATNGQNLHDQSYSWNCYVIFHPHKFAYQL